MVTWSLKEIIFTKSTFCWSLKKYSLKIPRFDGKKNSTFEDKNLRLKVLEKYFFRNLRLQVLKNMYIEKSAFEGPKNKNE